jgi:DNA mismatch repair protein MutL
MTNIKVLPENLINQIAAGEVVERPASVVKELVENSLDAGATRMIIEVNGGGGEYIRITDDGCGMDAEDAALAFERHATSKISSGKDLLDIRTMGFRGEAIASIASVSYFSLQTKKKGELEGTLIISEGGKIVKNKQLGCPAGTQIEVRQLFYNTPARKNYLKNDATEYGHILDTLTGIALAFPQVAFKLMHDGKVVFDLPQTEDLLSRIRMLLGKSVADELIPVFNGHSKMQLSGFIGKPSIARSNRKSQRLFVNNREVSSHVLSYAVKQSFYSLIPKEKHPTFILFLNLDPELVDVNVHPRKSEVRFTNEKEIFSIFNRACKSALEKYVLTPGFSEGPAEEDVKESVQDSVLHANREHQPLMKVEDTVEVEIPVAKGSHIQIDQPKTSYGGSGRYFSGIVQEQPDEETVEGGEDVKQMETPFTEREGDPEIIPLAQFKNSYILCSQGEDFVIMDQHAAHERIRYTEILEDFEAKKKSVQPLLTPEQLELSHQEAALLEEHKDLLAEMGFEIEPFGGGTFSVFAVPGYLVKEDIKGTVMGLIDDISNNAVKGDIQTRKERALTYAACRSAVKFGDPLSKEEMESLCKKLQELDLPYTCPHGRPTMIKMTPAELEKKFGRDY